MTVTYEVTKELIGIALKT